MTAKKFNSNIIVRFPGDNCIPDPNEIDKIIKFYIKHEIKIEKPLHEDLNNINFRANGFPDELVDSEPEEKGYEI